MQFVKTDIIPSKPVFVGEKNALDLKAICVFAATGFFLDQDTFFLDQKALKPAHEYEIIDGKVISSKPFFKWHYSPIDRPFDQVVQEFASLFETIINEQVSDKKVILPLSGGLDSRTQAAALHHLKKNVHSYSYEFENGFNETYYATKIAQVCRFPIEKWIIPKSYLWNNIEEIAKINHCYSEYTHPRQIAVLNKLSALGEIFSLGHWGDVLFDDMKVADDLPQKEQVDLMVKKVLKKGGLILANKLWKSWNLEGDFESYLKDRITILLQEINITTSANAQIRAFKSLYWAPRWTSVNLAYFEKIAPITLPYYDNRMCEFICTVPEKYLAGRKIQIAYLKLRNSGLAKIAWQDARPFNLYTYHWNKAPWNYPYRAYQKFKNEVLTKHKVANNYENQFIGEQNDKMLSKWLFEQEDFKSFIEPNIAKEIYENFKGKEFLKYSHPISTLLTFSLFVKLRKDEKI